MSSYAIRSDQDRQLVINRVNSCEMPCTVSFTKGAPRSNEQNRLQRKWCFEAGEQGDHTAEEYRAYCKLHLGVPILRMENEEFRAAYDEVIKPLAYELKIMAMAEPLDFPVTRLMTTKQKSKYLDECYQFFTSQGFRLTEPALRAHEEYR